MHSSVIVARIKPGSAEQIAEEFAKSDADPSGTGNLLRRQLFEYKGVYVQMQDHAEPHEPAAATPAETVATRFYAWHGQPVADPHRMHSTMIVARLDAADLDTVAKLFADFDTGTELPHTMGTRRRQLFACDGLYFHIQDFESADGGRLIEQAKLDPRFVQIQQDLLPYITVFDPATWRSPSDAMATRFYSWQAAA